MPNPRAVLRKITLRKPVPYCAHPQREDALNFLGAYVTETLECGHKVDVFFNPPLESLIAQRRRCQECDETEKVIEITAGKKKPPHRVGIPAAGTKKVLL